MTRALPEKPNLEFLKKQAKALRRAHKQHDPNAAQRIRQIQPTLRELPQEKFFEKRFSIIDAQHIIAREYDFPSWAKLKHYVESVSGISKEVLIRKFKIAVNSHEPSAIINLGKEHDLSEVVNAPLFLYGDPAILYINAIINAPIPMAKALLEVGADINAQTASPDKAYRILHYCLLRQDYNPDAFKAETQFYLEQGIALDPWSACGLGYFEKLKEFIEKDPSLISQKGPGGKTLLHFAREEIIIDYLLEQGANIDERCNNHGATPIQHAILRKEACKHLLKKGARPDVFVACQLNDLGTLKELYRSDPNCIHEQTGRGNFSNKISRYGQLIQSYISFNLYPVQLTYQHTNKVTYSFILDRCTDEKKILYAAACGDIFFLKELLAQNKNQSIQLKDELYRVLITACESENLEVIKNLINFGVSANTLSCNEISPLHIACYTKNKFIVEYLLHQDPDVNSQITFHASDKWNRYFTDLPKELTPLGCLIYSLKSSAKSKENTYYITKMLLQAGAEVDSTLLEIAPKSIKNLLEAHIKK